MRINLVEQFGYGPPHRPADYAEAMALVHPDDRERVARTVRSYLSGEMADFEVEHRILHRDGSYRWAFSRGVAHRDAEGRPVRLIGTVQDVTERKRAEEELRRARDELDLRVRERTAELSEALASLERQERARKELLGRIVTVQEEERRRISRELHDQMGQHLTALMLRLRGLKDSVGEDSPFRESLRWLEDYAARIGQEAHRIALDLRPTSLDDLGLPVAIANYAEDWSRRSGIEAEVRTRGLESERLPAPVETAIYGSCRRR